MNHNLAICVLGDEDSGKSYTWNKLFGRTVRTGNEIRRLYLSRSEYVEVFLVSGSPEERQLYVGDIIAARQPRIILCSMQYIEDVITTIKYFIDHDYFLFVHWLNPGFSDPTDIALFDSLGVLARLLAFDSLIGIRNAKVDATSRTSEIRDFIYGWAKSKGLLCVV